MPLFHGLSTAIANPTDLPRDLDGAHAPDAACFLLSDLARAITGSAVQVDGGHHAVA